MDKPLTTSTSAFDTNPLRIIFYEVEIELISMAKSGNASLKCCPLSQCQPVAMISPLTFVEELNIAKASPKIALKVVWGKGKRKRLAIIGPAYGERNKESFQNLNKNRQ